MHIICLRVCCISCIAYFLKNFVCLHVYCDLFDVLEITEINEDFTTKAPTLLLSMQVAYMKPPTYFCLCMFSLIYLSYACVG